MGTCKNWGHISNLILSAGPLTEVLDGRKNPINVLLHTMLLCAPAYIPQLILKRCTQLYKCIIYNITQVRSGKESICYCENNTYTSEDFSIEV